MKSFLLPLLTAILVIGAVQVPTLEGPPFGPHSFRQTQTATTIELFAQDGIDFFHPRTNYVGEPGVLVLEAPIFQSIAAVLSRWTSSPLLPARLLNLGFMLLSAAAVWTIMRKPLGPQVATAGTVLFLSSPLNQNYMSAVLIDPMAVCFSLWAFHFGASLLHESRRPGALWVGFTGCCLIGGSIKPLYLFPVGVMGLVWLVEHRRLNPRSVFFGAALLIAVSAILAWNHFAMLANAASPFTQGLRPTSLLGFSRLAEFSFLRRVARLLLIETLGPAGGLLALTGWGWLVLRWRCLDAERKRMLTVTGCAVFGYWFLFANIIFPHDYYSLIAVPFCAVAAATGAGFLAEAMGRRWPACGSATTRTTGIAALAALVAIAQYLRAGGVPSSPQAIEFERLTSGRFEPGAFAIVFIGAHRSPGGLPIHEAPSMLYAARLRGTGLVVADASQAVERWKALRPHYRHLRYVVFYGLDVPEEIASHAGKMIAEIPSEQFTAFELPAVE